MFFLFFQYFFLLLNFLFLLHHLVLYFPQIKPEKKNINIDLNEEEKLVFSIIQKEGKSELNVVKNKSELSNKKWDKTIKALTKYNLIKVIKNDDGLFIDIF